MLWGQPTDKDTQQSTTTFSSQVKRCLYTKGLYKSTKKKNSLLKYSLELCNWSPVSSYKIYWQRPANPHCYSETHPHIPWLQGYSHKHRVIKSCLQTPAAALNFKEETEDNDKIMLLSEPQHHLETLTAAAKPTLETHPQNITQLS